uniref:Leukocyte elastase inhibitor n=1 Tax=Neolamprologus brichardi TaxID=32507 RepID=A0A3Q4H4X9_NEOBR
MVSDNTSFSLALLKQLSNNNKTGNIFFSPFSISSALAMVMLGARGNTATQMSEILQTEDCWGDVHSSFAKLLTVLNRPDAPFTFSVANRLYGEKSCPFTQEFLIQSKKHYRAELESVDFKTRSEEVRIDVNHWVQQHTPGNITEVVDEDDLNELTRLVLFTATHFRGIWNKDFSWSETYDAQFWLNKNDSKPVKMMKQEEDFACTFIEEANCKILEMPYSGKEVSMLIFLPAEIEDDTTGLEKLEKELTYEKFVAWTHPGKMQTCYIDTYDLNTVLSSMGMVDAFDHTKCDFFGETYICSLLVFMNIMVLNGLVDFYMTVLILGGRCSAVSHPLPTPVAFHVFLCCIKSFFSMCYVQRCFFLFSN